VSYLLNLSTDSFCRVNLFTVNAVVLGKLTISPQGPIVVDVGTKVVIDCSSDEQLWPNTWWFRPFVSSSYQIKDILAHNATVLPWGEGRIGYKWIDETVLQLIILSATKQDSGTYWCLQHSVQHQQYQSIAFIVTDSLQPQQNVSGWQLAFISVNLNSC